MAVLALVVSLWGCRSDPSGLTPTNTGQYPQASQPGSLSPDVSQLPDGIHNLPLTSGTIHCQVITGKKEGYAKVFHSNGALYQQGPFANDVPHGWWETFDTTGALILSGAYQAGLKHGFWRIDDARTMDQLQLPNKLYPAVGWPRIGQVAEGHFERGSPRGHWRSFNPNGTVRMEGTLWNGHMNDWWRIYDAQGTITEEGHYTNGVRDGHHMRYENGVLREEREYKKGRRYGDSKTYDAQGKLEQITPEDAGGGLLP